MIRATMIATSLLAALLLAGCEREGPMERAGEQIDESAAEAGEKVDEAAENAGEKLEEAGEEIREKADD
jgi:hypothetical protein